MAINTNCGSAMKTITARDQAHLDTGNLTTATLWKLTRRDSEVFGFTDHDQDIVFGGLTYSASTSYNRTATADQAGFAVSNMVIESILDSSLIVESDVLAGLWDYAQVEMRTVNWKDRQTRYITGISKANPGVVTAPLHDLATGDEVTLSEVVGMTQVNGVTYTATVLTANTFSIGVNTTGYSTYLNSGVAKIPESSWNYRKGRIGQVNTSGQMFSAELLGLAKKLEKPLIRPYLPGCAAIFGDAECQVALGSYTITGTIESVDSSGLVITDTANITAAINTYAYGLMTMTSGDSSGYLMEVKSSTVGTVTLQQRMPFGVAVGDTYSLVQGCDGQFSTCKDTYDNVVNFQGFPDMPGQDKVLKYASN
jgi:uncharacterized phage protein (TIGR02218 family)